MRIIRLVTAMVMVMAMAMAMVMAMVMVMVMAVLPIRWGRCIGKSAAVSSILQSWAHCREHRSGIHYSESSNGGIDWRWGNDDHLVS